LEERQQQVARLVVCEDETTARTGEGDVAVGRTLDEVVLSGGEDSGATAE
jgi:hypothetical protein